MAAGLPAGRRGAAVDRRALGAAVASALSGALLELRPVRSTLVITFYCTRSYLLYILVYGTNSTSN